MWMVGIVIRYSWNGRFLFRMFNRVEVYSRNQGGASDREINYDEFNQVGEYTTILKNGESSQSSSR